MTDRSTENRVRIIDARSDSARARAVERAAELLDQGELVGLPTETVYGIGAGAAHRGAVRHLWESRGGADDPTGAPTLLAWHVSSPEALMSVAPLRSAAHRRLVERLAPGPVTFSVELSEVEARAMCDRAGAERGVFEDGAQALFRCPSPELARQVLERARGPVVMASLALRGSPARTAQEAAEALSRRMDDGFSSGGSALELLDDGSPALGRQSTLIRLLIDGGYRVVREGAIEARYIDKQLAMNMLFICTGNTCRSPMAAAIARRLIADAPLGGLRFSAQSAGVGAAEGSPATPEAVEALRRMSIDMGAHSSSYLTRDLLGRADLIFGMTRSHVEAARSMDPSASARIMLLDPDGKDIPDPVGQSQQVYDQAAASIRAAIERRLAAIMATPAS